MLAALVRFAVRSGGVVLAIALFVLAYGAYALSRAGLDIFPEFSPRQVILQTEAPGLTAEQVEVRVSQPIEQRLAGLGGLGQLRSESIQGLSVVTAVFGERSDVYRNRQQVSERLSTLGDALPPGAGPPVLVPLSSSSATVLTLGVTSRARNAMELRDWVDWTLKPRLLAVAGVADVNVFGGAVRELQIQPDPERLRRLRVGIDELVRAGAEAVATPGLGFVENTNQRLALQLRPLPPDPEALAGQVALRRDGHSLRLGDLARVAYGAEPPISAAAVGGVPGVVAMVIGQYGANTLTVSRAVEAALAELRPIAAAQEIELHPPLFRPADYIVAAIRNLSGHLALGAAFVVVVLYAFLANGRSALIPTLAIPLSLLGGAIVLLEAGISLNLMVLGGLAIALGEVVDDAIIDTENIFRRLRENRALPSPRPVAEVVFRASMEVRGSVVYATFIVAVVFVPLLTLGGVAGRLFAPLGLAYIVAILASLLVALTVTPALCALLLPRGELRHGEPPLLAWMQGGYRRLLEPLLPRSGLAAGLTLAVTGFALLLTPGLRTRFLPELREGHYIVHTTALPGTALNEAMRMGNLLVERFLEIPGVVSASQWAGRAERGADTYGSHYSEYEVKLKPGLSGQAQQRILDRLRGVLDGFPGLRYEANTFLTERVNETISGYTAPLVVNLYGPDLAQLDGVAVQVAQLLGRMPGAGQIQIRSPAAVPVLAIDPDPARLRFHGIAAGALLGAIEAAYDGVVVGRVYAGNRAIAARVILPESLRGDPAMLAELPVFSAEIAPLRLRELAEVRQTEGRYNVLRQAGQRVQTVTAQLENTDWEGFVASLRRRMGEELRLPAGVYPEYTGAAVEQGAARRELILHALLAGAGVFVFLYAAIGSLRNLLLTLANLPFSLAGGVAAVLVSGQAVSVGSLVGFVTLFGITVRNSIMLITHYRRLVEEDRLPWNAATALRGARERLPSILMTALVTGLAMLPIALDSDNAGREIMGPMAGIIIGGLITSTLLNLLLLPVLLLRHGRFAPAT